MDDRTLHDLLDHHYGSDAERTLVKMLDEGADPNRRVGPLAETPLHVATRRYRPGAVTVLLDRGADIDAKTVGGKTAYAHAVRRGFDEVADILRLRGASTSLNWPDRLAVAVVSGRLQDAREILAGHPSAVRTGNAEEDRLLADVAGRADTEAVRLLIHAGADLAAHGLDSGTPLHQAAWFGQPENARLLIDAGAPLDVFDEVHESSPIGWAVHGSRFSGDAENRQEAYVALVDMFLEAGSSVCYPNETESDAYWRRLLEDATPRVREVLENRRGR
jgi:ankyrin repeat protein